MMAVKAPIPFSLNSSATSPSFGSKPTYPILGLSPQVTSQEADTKGSTNFMEKDLDPIRRRSSAAPGDQLPKSASMQPATPQEENTVPLAPVETDAETTDNGRQGQALSNEPHSGNDVKRVLVSPAKSGPLKIDIDKSTTFDPSARTEEEPPQSVIHAPVGFGKFNRIQPTRSSVLEGQQQQQQQQQKPSIQALEPKSMGTSIVSAASSESTASDVTVTKAVGTHTDPIEKLMQIPPLQTQIPIAPEWTRTPRAQTRNDLGVFSRPGSSLSSLASISETDDDHPDQPSDTSAAEAENTEPKTPFYRDEADDVRILSTALTECWTLCNTLASLSLVHREMIFSKKGNMQQQAWRSCWRLCQNLYEARVEKAPMNVRLTLDLCREFCQALFDVRARENENADSVLRVSFELNNHLFNTHDRTLPEAFSERTLDFYITLCHRLMKQRSSTIEETGSLLRACWGLAEMLFSLRQTRREGRRPDEDLLSSSIQACWELCDLFRDGWTQIRPERQTPRPAHTTLTQAFQQARNANSNSQDGTQPKVLPETPTTIFEDLNAESPYESHAPNIVVLGPEGENHDSASVTSTNPQPQAQANPRPTTYYWPSANSKSSVTTLSTTSDASLDSSIRTIRSPSDDPSMALLKALFVRAAMKTNRGFSPLASTSITTVSSLSSLPLFVKSLPEIAFGSQAWQMGLLDNYRKAIANDATFRALGLAANPTLLGLDGDEATQSKIKFDTAIAVQSLLSGTFGWNWLKDLFKFAFGVHLDDAVNSPSK